MVAHIVGVLAEELRETWQTQIGCGMHGRYNTCIRGDWLSRLQGMSLYTILLIVLILMLIGALPTWPHSAKWGYGPSGGLGTILVIVIILYVLGVIPR